MESVLFLIPLLPLLAFAFDLLLGRRFVGRWAHIPAWLAMAISFVISVLAFLEVRRGGHAISQTLWHWMPGDVLGGFDIPFTIYVDQLTSVMILIVTGIGLLIHIYSAGYMAGDGGYYRFFAYLSLFIFSMLILVLGDNYLIMFFGWEGVGLCSYLLIGYWFNQRDAEHHLPADQLAPPNAARKAFIVNRVGDMGFIIGMFLAFTTFGTLSFFGPEGIFAQAPNKGAGVLNTIGLLLFIGAIGKSAQIPLYVWLADAMAGPTPVSALIHAATMVTAGVYMMARSSALYSQAPIASQTILWIGLGTAFLAASIGLVQNDIKKVLAYSTVSQLGYMVLGIGAGAFVPAIFHLLTHAFFKALLFLGSGSVIHGTGTQDIRQMGGLKRYQPITYWTMLCGALALSGVLFTSGFFSKDEILVTTWHAGFPVATIIGYIVAFMTAFYTFRMFFLTFHGEPRFDAEHHPPHESPLVMTLPLIILAVPALIIGLIVGPLPALLSGRSAEASIIGEWLHPIFAGGGGAHEGAIRTLVTAVEESGPSLALTLSGFVASTIISALGILLAYQIYVRGRPSPRALARRYSTLYDLFLNKWYVDEIYQTLIVQPLYWWRRMRADSPRPEAEGRFAREDVEGNVRQTGLAVLLWRWVDDDLIDGMVNGLAYITALVAQRLRKVQTGVVSNYALAIVLGTVLIVGAYLLFGPQFLGK